MKSTFDAWNEEKFYIHSHESMNGHINEREIWYVKLGVNVGYEYNGKKRFRRPVLVLKKIGAMFLVAPLSTKGKENRYWYELESVDFERSSWVSLSHIRTIDKKRFMTKIGMAGQEEFEHIKKLLTEMYFL